MNEPDNAIKALRQALVLALTAPDEARARRATKLAGEVAAPMEAVVVEQAKEDALALQHLQRAIRALRPLCAQHGEAHDARTEIRDAIHKLGGDSFFDDQERER